MNEIIKLNLGGGPKKIEGYINVDALFWSGVTDVVHNLVKFPWPFPNNHADEILSQEFLEHISYKETINILRECHRILKPEGKLIIQVPDCGRMMEYYVNKEVCDCVPHKAKDYDSFFSDAACFKCGGKGKVNPMRWLFAFIGAQKHEYDTHMNIFTKESMENSLKIVQFKDIKFEDNIYKLIVSAIK